MGVSEKEKQKLREKAEVRTRCMNLSSRVQVTSDDDRFICGHGSGWLMWVEVNIIRDEEVKDKTTTLLGELFTCTLKKLSLISGLGMKGQLCW